MKVNNLSRVLGAVWRKPFVLTAFLVYQTFILLYSVAFESVEPQFLSAAIVKLIVIATLAFYSHRGNRTATFVCAAIIIFYGLYNIFIGIVMDFSRWILRLIVLTLSLYLVSAGTSLLAAERRRARVAKSN